ncbi:MAG: hypothetical protein DDT31_01980 [Syntrophomonadaceae bacterium]|nr:hypothetical protein [Bacillota bacterium]
MQVLEELARFLDTSPEELERESLKSFLGKELREVEAEMYKLGARHGIQSVLELDEKLKEGEINEEEMREDFMELDYLESRRDTLLKAMGRVQ